MINYFKCTFRIEPLSDLVVGDDWMNYAWPVVGDYHKMNNRQYEIK